MPTTGNGTTISFAESGFTAQMTNIEGNEETRAVLNISHLLTSESERKMPGDLVDRGAFNIEFYFNPDEATAPIEDDPELVTIT
jgi:hypothetical protein